MDRRSTALLAVALAALTVAAYLPMWNNQYIDFDDASYITANSEVLEGLTPSGFCWAWTFHGKYWQPLSWLSLQVDADLFPSDSSASLLQVPSAAAIHAENLCWHVASALLLFGLCLRLTGAHWRSFLVAALFALHPMRVESVAWAAERKDVLSIFFGLLTVWAYVRYVEQPRWRRYLVVVLVYAVSLLCKPTLMTLPFVLLLLDYWPLCRLSPTSTGGPGRTTAARRWLVLEKAPLLALAAVVGIVTLLAREQGGKIVSLDALPLSARLANAGTAYGWYLVHTLVPWGLAVLYPHPYEHWSLTSALVGASLVVLITALALWQRRRQPWLIVGWLWFLATLLPVIGLAQGGEQAWADRFTYWPHIGLFVAAVWAAAETAKRCRIPALLTGTCAAAVLGLAAVITAMQVTYWHDTESLWRRALAVTEDNHRAHFGLATYYAGRGQTDEAHHHAAEAVRLRPRYANYQLCLSATLAALGRKKEAAEHLQLALDKNAVNGDEAFARAMQERLRLSDGATQSDR